MLDIDMELLRRLGVLRRSFDAEPGPEAVKASREALASVRDRAGDGSEPAAGAFTALAAGLDLLLDGGVRRADLVAIVDALEPVLSGDGDAASVGRLAEVVGSLESVAAERAPEPEDGSEAGALPAAGADEDDESLHEVASFLIQMEPTLMDSIETLHDRFASTVEQWTGSDTVRSQLEEALAELGAVAQNSRSRKTKRVEVVERVGEVIEVAMREEEDNFPVAAPEGPTAVNGGDAEDASAAPGPVSEVDALEAPASEAEQSAEASADVVGDDPFFDPFDGPVFDDPEPVAPAAAPVPSSVDAAGGTSADHGTLSIEMKRPGSLDTDPELVTDFVAEGLDYLTQSEEALLTLESDPTDAEAVNVTFRAFHTIKGVAAFLELEQVAGIAHEAETLLAQVREGSLAFTETAADLFLRSADVLRGLLLNIRDMVGGATPEPPAGLPELIEQLNDPKLAEKVANNEALLGAGAVATGGGTVSIQSSATPRRRKGDIVGGTGGDDSVRIRTQRLDALVDLVGELVVSFSMVSQDPDVVLNRGDLQKKVGHSSKILRELQDLSTSLRMVPLKPAFHKISRVVRDVAKKMGKDVELITIGEETELDRSMVGVVTDPLVHMVRNSIDHGIEPADVREAAGKPARGTVRLTAQQTGGNVVITIEDDGKGLDKDKLLQKAIDNGVVDRDRTMSDSEIFNLVFHPGLSTAARVTDISGRGVGMDVVKRAVESLRGRIEIQSEVGVGTKFMIHLPLTLAITDGMLVRIGAERYIVPTMKIQLSLRPTDEDLWTVSGRGEMVMLHGQLIPIARLHRIFGLDGSIEDPREALLVVVGDGSRKTALLVDELLGQQQFVVKPLTGAVADTPGVAGGAILGDGGVGLILDPEGLIELARASASTGEAAA